GRLEGWKVRLDRVAARREGGECRDAGFGGLRFRHRLGACGRLTAGEGDRGADDDRVGLVEDGDAKRRGRGRLREHARCARGNKTQDEQDSLHFGISNFRGSIFALIRKRSKMVSSIVSAPTARRMRKGSLSPSTSR